MKNLMTYCILLVGILCFPAYLQGQGSVRFVKAGASGDGTSWANASGDLQSMIDASVSGDEVWIAAGVYKPSKLIKSNKKRSYAFLLKNGVSLIGGFVGSEQEKGQREQTKAERPLRFRLKHETIISGNLDDNDEQWTFGPVDGAPYRHIWTISGHEHNSNHLLYMPEVATKPTIIDGLVLTGAFADTYQVKAAGAALYALGDVHLINSTIQRNATYTRAEGNLSFSGGAVYLGKGSGKARIDNCTFSENQAYLPTLYAEGGAIYIESGSVSNSLFRGNVGVDEGGSIRAKGSSITDCHFYDCYAAKGGSISAEQSTIERCLIASSRAIIGGGIYAKQSLIHHTRVLNSYADGSIFASSGGTRGGGIYGESETTIIGSLVANCTSDLEGGGIAFGTAGKLYHSTIRMCNALRTNQPISNVYLGNGGVMLNSIADDDPTTQSKGFARPSSIIGSSFDSKDIEPIYASDWSLTAESTYIGTGEFVPNEEEPTDMLGNARVRDGKIDRGAFAYSKVERTPAIVVTMAQENSSISLGVGGSKGTSFGVDFGSGEVVEYEGAKVINQTVQGKTIKIYGDNILVFVANKQGIAELNLSKANKLMKLQVMDNSLKSLDVTQCPNLYMLYCDRNKISNKLDLSAQSRMNVLSCGENLITSTLDLSHIRDLTSVICNGNEIEQLILPKDASKLTTINCDDNRLKHLDLGACGQLEELLCANNQLEALDVSYCPKLTKLYAIDNALGSLNLRQNPQLKTLTLTKNRIKAIDLKYNTAIENLYLGDNQLQTIDLSSLPELQWLILDNNQLREVNLERQSKLKQIKASHNQLERIDLSHNPDLSVLWVGNNRLGELDLSRQKQLIWLVCDSNKLEHLPMAANKNIVWLECQGNAIADLQVEHMGSLQKLIASRNKLTDITLRGNSGIQGVRLEDNELPKATLERLLRELPNVSKVEINDNNIEWAKQIDISNNYESNEIDTSTAIAKGWSITNAPAKTTGVDQINLPIGMYFDNNNRHLVLTHPYSKIEIYDMQGVCVLRRAHISGPIDVSILPVGSYIAVGYGIRSQQEVLRFVI